MAKKKADTYRLVGLSVKDVLGIEEFELRPGKVTVLEGPNGSGKTSVLTAIQAALGGGTSLARLARILPREEQVGQVDDPESSEAKTGEPEVVLLLEDGAGRGYRVEQDAAGVEAKAQIPGTQGYKNVDIPPRSWLKTLWDGQGANPAVFSRQDLDEKVRTKMLLESLSLSFDLDEFKDVVRLPASVKLPSKDLFTSPLTTVAFIREAVYDTRTAVNRDAKAKTAAAEQTRAKVPLGALEERDPAQEAQDEATVTRLVREVGAAEEAAAGERRSALAASQAAYLAMETESHTSLKAAIASLQAQLDRDVAKLQATYNETVAGMRESEATYLRERSKEQLGADGDTQAAHDKALQAIVSKREELAQARQRVAGARAARELAAGYTALVTQATAFEQEAGELASEGEALTNCLDRIDVYRAEMAKEIPVEGLEVREGVIHVNGVPFSQLNTAQRVKIAVDVASLRVKGLPLLLIDGVEGLDAEHQAELMADLKARGIQAILGMVSPTGGKLKTWSER